jgi:hypothetical protein
MIFAWRELPVKVGAPGILVNIADVCPDQLFDAMSIAARWPMCADNVESMFLSGPAFAPTMKRHDRAAS